MISVRRKPGVVPASLDKPFRDGKTELERAVAHYIDCTDTSSFEFDRYRKTDVKQALDDIFHGKCAYCESLYAKTQPVDVEHYRPKGKVDDADGHRGYWWLAMDWLNLVPSCIHCNRKSGQRTPNPDDQGTMVALNDQGEFVRGKTFNTGKQSAFPLVMGSPRARWDQAVEDVDLHVEQRLLLDPTRDTPEDHLVFHIDRDDPEKLISIVYPKSLAPGDELVLPVLGGPAAVAQGAGASNVSAIGAVSIQVYGLNRLSLVQARTKMLRDLEFLLEMSISLKSLSSDVEARIEDRKPRILAASGSAKTELEKDEALDLRIITRIDTLSDKVLAQMTAMTEPKAEFSALAQAWMTKFLSE